MNHCLCIILLFLASCLNIVILKKFRDFCGLVSLVCPALKTRRNPKAWYVTWNNWRFIQMFSGGLSCAGEQICCSSADSPLLTCWSFTKSSCFCSFVTSQDTMHVLWFSVCSFIRSKFSLILIWFISFFVLFHHFVSFIWCFAYLVNFFHFFLSFFFFVFIRSFIFLFVIFLFWLVFICLSFVL